MRSIDFPEWSPPTDGQKAAGNYLKPRVLFGGMEIAVENPSGTTRTGKNEDGSAWSVKMQNHYGYIVGSIGVDGDPMDVYIGDDADSVKVFVVHQNRYGAWDEYDEDKAMLGFDSQDDAVSAYLAHYDDPRFLGDVIELSLDNFKQKVLAKTGDMIKSRVRGDGDVKSLIDLSGLSCACETHIMELFSKATSEDGHDIWAPHENPFLSKLVELFTERGLIAIDGVKAELQAWLEGRMHTGLLPHASVPGMAPVWTSDELSLVRLYLERLPAGRWTLGDYDYLVQYLFQRYLPSGEMMSDVEWLVTRAHMLGKTQAYLGSLPLNLVDVVVSALPLTVSGAVHAFSLSAAEQHILLYAKMRSADLVVDLVDSARHSVNRIVFDHMARQMSGDVEATPGKLQQRLFDNFAGMNRDWRRIALTEAGEAANQGLIASLPERSQAKRMEMYRGACGFCKKIDGRVFNVVSVDDPEKNGETDIWLGKTNVGRSSSPRKRTDEGLAPRSASELWWVAAGVQHPHCRGGWLPLSQPKEGNNPEFTAWLRQRLGVKHGVSLADWSWHHGAVVDD